MTVRGWVDLSLKQEWADWIDEYLKSNPHGLKSRAAVVEFALEKLRASTRDLSVEELEKLSALAAETYSALEDLRKKRGQNPRTTAGKTGSR